MQEEAATGATTEAVWPRVVGSIAPLFLFLCACLGPPAAAFPSLASASALGASSAGHPPVRCALCCRVARAAAVRKRGEAQATEGQGEGRCIAHIRCATGFFVRTGLPPFESAASGLCLCLCRRVADGRWRKLPLHPMRR
jgi:hypothetical protein